MLAPDQHKGEKWEWHACLPGRIVGRAKHPSNHCRPRDSKQSVVDTKTQRTVHCAKPSQTAVCIRSWSRRKFGGKLTSGSFVLCGQEVVAADDCCCWAPRELDWQWLLGLVPRESPSSSEEEFHPWPSRWDRTAVETTTPGGPSPEVPLGKAQKGGETLAPHVPG